MAGIAAAKAKDFEKAERYLQEAVKLDSSDPRANRLLRRVQALTRRRQRSALLSLWVQVLLVGVLLAQVVAIWVLMVLGTLGQTQFAALLPVLLGLVLVVFLLPRLTQLKLPGFEAKMELPADVSPAEALLQLSPGELQPLFGTFLGLPERR